MIFLGAALASGAPPMFAALTLGFFGSVRCIGLAPVNRLAEPFGQAATQAPQPMQAATETYGSHLPEAGPRLSAEQASEEATGGFLFHMALAALVAQNAVHDLVDVLAAPGPSGLLTGLAGDSSAHGRCLSLRKYLQTIPAGV